MISGNIKKMRVENDAPAQYSFRASDKETPLNALIGEKLAIRFDGVINCTNCGRETKKSYSQGHCFPCSQRLASCDLCVLQPVRCHFHKGTCREPQWGEENCMQPHRVYFSVTSGVKVGITRVGQIPTRWLDQGATQAIEVACANTRRAAGLLEARMSKEFADRTDWRAMLRGDAEPVDLVALRQRVHEECEELRVDASDQHEADRLDWVTDTDPQTLSFPVTQYPKKIKSINLMKIPEYEDVLMGIKGQYLIFENAVMNVRSHTGFHVTLETP